MTECPQCVPPVRVIEVECRPTNEVLIVDYARDLDGTVGIVWSASIRRYYGRRITPGEKLSARYTRHQIHQHHRARTDS